MIRIFTSFNDIFECGIRRKVKYILPDDLHSYDAFSRTWEE